MFTSPQLKVSAAIHRRRLFFSFAAVCLSGGFMAILLRCFVLMTIPLAPASEPAFLRKSEKVISARLSTEYYTVFQHD